MIAKLRVLWSPRTVEEENESLRVLIRVARFALVFAAAVLIFEIVWLFL